MDIRECYKQLSESIERAESDDWCVLNLNVQEGKQWLAAIESVLPEENIRGPIMTVDKIKVPKCDIIPYFREILYNDGYYWANCETGMLNSQCFYLDHGCKGCTTQRFLKT